MATPQVHLLGSIVTRARHGLVWLPVDGTEMLPPYAACFPMAAVYPYGCDLGLVGVCRHSVNSQTSRYADTRFYQESRRIAAMTNKNLIEYVSRLDGLVIDAAVQRRLCQK